MVKSISKKHVLSKSTFMRGCQCNKSLWLYKNRNDLRGEISQGQELIFQRGTDVGILARDLFPGGVDASPVDAFHYQQSVKDTASYIEAGHKVIYEAAFQFDGILAAIDILVRKKGKWYAYEVKSSTQVKPQFIQDVALQYYVISNSGLKLEEIYLIHINNTYVKDGPLELDELFTVVPLKKEVKVLQTFVAEKEKELMGVVKLKSMPDVDVGPHCTKPYDCDFYDFCWKDIHVDSKQQEEIINKKEIKLFLKQLEYPIYYMDFETFMQPVPEYDGHWPYRQIPFQYSIHKQLSMKMELEHFDFLSDNNADPCGDFIKCLLNNIGNKGSVIVYNKSFENSRLEELIDDFPKLKKQIQNIQARLIDLMVPFRKKHFYLPAMNGSYSIKNVLPAMVPELTYEGLTIGNGNDASVEFYNLRFETDEGKVRVTRNALLEYCHLDTMAMVKILEKLMKV